MDDNTKKVAIKQTLLAAVIIPSLGILYYLFIRITGFAFPCIFRSVTGYRCPSCGITHMFIDIFHLRIKSAFWDNPMTFILTLPVYILVLFITYYSAKREKIPRILYILSYTAVGIAVFFCIIRNIFNF